MYSLKFNWLNFQTDKSDLFLKTENGNSWIEVGHGYGRAYDKHLFSLRSSVKKILEIGTRPGSISLWLSYFPNAHVYGIDIINPNVVHERFTYENVDQSNREQLEQFFKTHGNDFDIIIDDGLHAAFEQQVTLDVGFKNLIPGGCFIIEDMHCQREEEKDGPHYRETKNTNKNMYEVIEDFQNGIFDACTNIQNSKEFESTISKIHVETARNCRWITMSKPSEIIFIEKSLS